VQIVSEPPPLFSGADAGAAPGSEVASLSAAHVLPNGLSQLLPPDAVLPKGVVRGPVPYLPKARTTGS
jgi:hypothetical protein